jgi:hypothetical protein
MIAGWLVVASLVWRPQTAAYSRLKTNMWVNLHYVGRQDRQTDRWMDGWINWIDEWDLRFSRRRVWRWLSSSMLCRAVWQKFTDVSEVFGASIIRMMMDRTEYIQYITVTKYFPRTTYSSILPAGWMAGVRLPAQAEISVNATAPTPPHVQSMPEREAVIHFHLVLRLRMSGGKPTLPHTWCSIKHRGSFSFLCCKGETVCAVHSVYWTKVVSSYLVGKLTEVKSCMFNEISLVSSLSVFNDSIPIFMKPDTLKFINSTVINCL